MTTITCTHCGETCAKDDVFCEACGFDFIAGSLPAAEQTRPPSLVTPQSDSSGPTVLLEIAVDESYFGEVVTEGEIAFPDPLPADQQLEFTGSEIHIGRTSESRAVHPDVDVALLTNDPAVSTRHAVLRFADDGTFTIQDVGSTNGTFLAAPDSSAISPGDTITLEPGTPVFVGAWTRLTVADVKSSSVVKSS